jgi:tetratricopeptide (TPR) repeat protein
MMSEPVLAGLALTVLVVLDLHSGYWSAPVKAGMRISKGRLLTALRVAESISALAFFYLLSATLQLDMIMSIAMSVAAAACLSIAMYKKDMAQRRMMALGLYEARIELAAIIKERIDAHAAMLKEGQDRFLVAQEKVVKEVVSKANVMGREAKALLEDARKRSGELGLAAARLGDALQRLNEKEEALDLLRSQLEVPQDARDDQTDAVAAQLGSRLTSEDGRANRLKGLEAQKELADMVRGWGLSVRVGYGKGVPDFRVIKEGNGEELMAVIACKAFTLSEAGTKQRRIGKADVAAELKYAKSKKVPLVLAVKNLVTGQWWMHWVPVGEQQEFDGISTPVILAEDGGEAVKVLVESVASVREKLQGVL